ncbi:GyrI-like domain-containing protein [Paenibacillus sp. BAC0078]
MNFRIISLPSFKAVISGVDKAGDFADNGVLRSFDKFFSSITPKPHESFMPRDFLYYDEEKQGMVWIWALTESGETGGFETIDFEGGLYITFSYRDGDSETHDKLHQETFGYINDSPVLELDIRPNHYCMGHIITPKSVIDVQGWAQMEVFIPVRLKS